MPIKKKTHSETPTVEDIVERQQKKPKLLKNQKKKKLQLPVVVPVQAAKPVEAPREVTTNSRHPTHEVHGILDIQPEGHGFLRPRFIPSQRDIYISQSQIRRFMLRPGDLVAGVGRPPKDTERYFGLLKVERLTYAGRRIIKQALF